ncbi:MAG TPA: N-acetyltransferase [Dongiaceae bacterium]|nr:N-acetyltransferase [Dongiaceae bacterium]
MSDIAPSLTRIERATALSRADLADLIDAAVAAIEAGGGFGWIDPPYRDVMEAYWKGVLLIPDRHLIVARLDHIIAGSCQLQRPGKNNEAQAHTIQLTTSFVAPWARGHGLARQLTLAAEEWAKELGASVINLDVRATQQAAVQLYRSLGYTELGTHPHYARVRGSYVSGIYFWKDLA